MFLVQLELSAVLKSWLCYDFPYRVEVSLVLKFQHQIVDKYYSV